MRPIPSHWSIRRDLILLNFRILFSWTAWREGSPPETHFVLYDLYWRLSIWYDSCGKKWIAEKLRALALFHWEATGYNEIPPAVALAMPIPAPPLFINAVAGKTSRFFFRRGALRHRPESTPPRY